MKKSLMAALALAALAAQAQAQAPAASAAPAKAMAPSSPAKKALVAKVLALQQPGIEAMARQMTEQPVVPMLQQAGAVLQQRVPPERRDAVAKDIQADARKYVDETTPLVRATAVKLAPTTIGTLLEERFTEDELKQVVALLESPVNKKLQSLAPEMQRALSEKLVAEMRGTVQPRVQALEQSIIKRLETSAAPPAGASAPK